MNRKWSTLSLLLLFLVSNTFSSEVSGGFEGTLYEETMENYSRINGETFRWDSHREFLLKDYEEVTLFSNGNEIPGIQMEIMSDSQNGQFETIIEPFKGMNFELEIILLDDGRISEFRWDMFLFRKKALYTGFPNEFFAPGNQHFDLDNEENFFTVNLEYVERHNSSGDIRTIDVNTELSAKNNDDGRTTRTAIHIIKRINSDIIFEYNWVINEVSTLSRYLNLFDQPYLWVPLQIASVFLLIFIYLRIHKFWVDNDIRIIRGKGKIISIELIENETTNDETAPPDQSDNETED